MPECEYPGCDRFGTTRLWLRAIGEHRVLCSVHAGWDGTRPTGREAFKAARQAAKRVGVESEEEA